MNIEVLTGIVSQSESMMKVLTEWLEILEKFKIDDTCEKEPYCHVELTNTGLLAVAVWKACGVAIQEYDIDEENKLDLYIRMNNEKFICEFKYDLRSCKQTSISENNGLKKIKNNTLSLLNEAEKDLEKKQNVWDEQAVNLYGVFITPLNNLNVDCSNRINEYLKWLISKKPFSLAWWFPKEMRKKEYPGIVLVLKTLNNLGCESAEQE